MQQYFGKLQVTHQAWTTIGTVQAVNKNDRTISFVCGDALLTIRVRLAATRQFIPRPSWAIALDDPEWATVPFEVKETEVVV